MDGPHRYEMVRDKFKNHGHVTIQQLLVDAEKPLCHGCPDFTQLFTIVELLNLKGNHGCSGTFFMVLLVMLKMILLKGNEFVENTYEANFFS